MPPAAPGRRASRQQSGLVNAWREADASSASRAMAASVKAPYNRKNRRRKYRACNGKIMFAFNARFWTSPAEAQRWCAKHPTHNELQSVAHSTLIVAFVFDDLIVMAQFVAEHSLKYVYASRRVPAKSYAEHSHTVSAHHTTIC